MNMNHKPSTIDIERALNRAARTKPETSHIRQALRGELLGQIIHATPLPATSRGTGGLLRWAPMLVATTILVASGTAALANSSKPGDFLYPVDTFTEQVSHQLIRSESARAKFYASMSEERTEELRQIEAKITDDLPEPKRIRIQTFRDRAKSNADISFERLNQVQAVVLEKYSISTDVAKKDALLKLSKQLQQVIDRRAEKAEKLEEILRHRGPEAPSPLGEDMKLEIRSEIRQQFQLNMAPVPFNGGM